MPGGPRRRAGASVSALAAAFKAQNRFLLDSITEAIALAEADTGSEATAAALAKAEGKRTPSPGIPDVDAALKAEQERMKEALAQDR